MLASFSCMIVRADVPGVKESVSNVQNLAELADRTAVRST